MPGKEDYTEVEEDIRQVRQLPYTITVEKVDGDIIYCHNIWGNSIKYRRNEKSVFDVIKDD
jgi:hypothetical protein